MDAMPLSRDATSDRTDTRASSDLAPGKLRGEAVLTLQTQQASRLVRGRPATADKPPIIGLLGFAALCRSVWHGARADDPYADWWRWKIDEALSTAPQEIEAENRRLDTLKMTSQALNVAPAYSVKPARIVLMFTNPNAFRAAALIGQYDRLACRALALVHTGSIRRDEAGRTLHNAGRAVRRALQSAAGYRFLGIDREAVRQGTATALQAQQVMGDCPASFIVAASLPETEPLETKAASASAASHTDNAREGMSEPSAEHVQAESLNPRGQPSGA